MSQDSLTVLMNQAKKVSFIPYQEQIKMFKEWKKTGNKRLVDQLVSSNIRLVYKEAFKQAKYFPHLREDLISAGLVGLSRAPEKFDPNRGVSFTSFCQYWIRAEMMAFLLQNSRMMKINTTQADRKLFFKRGRVNEIILENDPEKRETLVAKLAEDLSLKKEKIVEHVLFLCSPEIPIESKCWVFGGGFSEEMLVENSSYQEDFQEAYDKQKTKQELDYYVSLLPERKRFILEKYYGEEKNTLTNIGKMLGTTVPLKKKNKTKKKKTIEKNTLTEFRIGLSRQRVQQQLEQSLTTLREALTRDEVELEY